MRPSFLTGPSSDLGSGTRNSKRSWCRVLWWDRRRSAQSKCLPWPRKPRQSCPPRPPIASPPGRSSSAPPAGRAHWAAASICGRAAGSFAPNTRYLVDLRVPNHGLLKRREHIVRQIKVSSLWIFICIQNKTGSYNSQLNAVLYSIYTYIYNIFVFILKFHHFHHQSAILNFLADLCANKPPALLLFICLQSLNQNVDHLWNVLAKKQEH